MTSFRSRARLLGATMLAAVAVSPAFAEEQAQAAAQPATTAQPVATSQPAGAAPARRAEAIVVTGSRIARPQFEGTIPGVQIGADDIRLRSFGNALDILTDIGLTGTGATFNGNNGGQTASLGAAFADLLDLGTQRTLVLVNGRRYVSGNAGSIFVFGNETGGQVDLNNIPVGLIERTDVLTVGGAAAYGSDAIAGVINYILKDDYEGSEIFGRYGLTDRGDGATMALRGLFGRNLLDDRLNAVLALEYNWVEGIQASEREFRTIRNGSATNFANGSRRNPNFAPGIIDVTAQNNGAFLRALDDGISGSVFATGFVASNLWPAGVIFNTAGTLTTLGAPGQPTTQIGPFTQTFVAGATQLIPGVPGVGNPQGATGRPLSTFAPSALPAGVTAAQVFSTFNITPPAGATAAQLNTLALNVLQANRQTPREFFAANPTSLNAILGTFVAAFPDVANTDPATAAFLPRVARPIRFNDAGNIESWTVARLGPGDPSTLGGSLNGDGFDPIFNTVLRVEQERANINFNATFRFSDSITLFTENAYSSVRSTALRNGASANSQASSTDENAALIVNVNNPFLDANDRAALAAAGITSNFVLSRTNQDIMGDNPVTAESETIRTVVGARGDFSLFERDFDWETTFSYGRVEAEVTSFNIKDLEYALAIDAAVDPATGQIRCRSQLSPTLPTNLPGIFTNVVRRPGADGVPTDQLFRPQPTREIVDACVPLNVFGFNQMSDAAKAYVLAETTFNSVNDQTILAGFLNGDILQLPAGPLQFSLAGEYRKDTVDYSADQFNQLGRSRTAPSSTTIAETEALEGGLELRIPILGEDFTLPFLGELELSPAVRWVKLEGSAPTFRNITGRLISPRYEGDVEQIWSVAFTWKPIDDITFRGNVSRSLRQPSIVELFLGGQPFFTTATDPCSNANIGLGPNPANRRANCQRAVIAAGLATDTASANTFLNGFVPTGAAFQGLISGEQGLRPETAETWTAGVVLRPRFIEGLTLSADYINLELTDSLGPLLATPAANFCFDSATFPDTTPQLGVNACSGIVRDGTFNFSNGFVLPFFNLPGQRLDAWNINLEYRRDIAELFGLQNDWGRIRVRGNVYHLIEFADSPSGTFSGDIQRSDGTFLRPNWETQLQIGWARGGWDARWTWNWQDKTIIRSAGTPVTIEQQNIIGYPDWSLHDASVSYEVTDGLEIVAVVNNVFDTNYAGERGRLVGQYVDQIGRRYSLAIRAEF